MKNVSSDITIIGGGLTGLLIAYLLRDKKMTVNIIEARERFGGRIYTKYGDAHPPQEMGATWLGKQHQQLRTLLATLNIGVFEQILGDTAIYEPISTSPAQLVRLPPNNDPSFRIQGGTATLIQTLAASLDTHQIHIGQAVESIEEQGDYLLVKTADCEFKSPVVISTLPPFLLVNSIQISPNLPDSFLKIANETHTWMGDSIKIGLTYKKPFWREANASGTIFSNVGPIPEMYDHTNFEDNKFALKGFFNGAYFSVSKAERLAMTLKQLEKYFGQQVHDYLTYEEAVWRTEPYTFSVYPTHVLPHQNNGHAVFQQAFLGGKLLVAGSETSTAFPGYMEGAVRSAEVVFQRLEGRISFDAQKV